MSLIITKIENDKIYILADTQITPAEYLNEKPFDGLKIFFLSRMIAIAYSGAITIAHKIIYEVYKKHYRTPDLNLILKEIEHLRQQEKSRIFY